MFSLSRLKAALFLLPVLCGMSSGAQQKNYAKLVNPFIGTGGHGHTYPGATMPFGMVQLSPDTRLKGWDGCSGYHYSDSAIYGFSHTHLNGTGIEDYCDILLQPTTGAYRWNNEDYKSSFSHQNEKAYAGYYGVKLDKYNIGVELTATLRTGLHKYSYPAGTKEGNVLLDLLHRDIVLDSWLQKVDDHTLIGMRQSRSWAHKQTVFFALRFSKPIMKYTVALNEEEKGALPKAEGRNIKAYSSFDVSDGKPLLVQVAISGVSAEGAMKNLEAEDATFDFTSTLSKATAAWDKELGKIDVAGGTADERTVFYTALYHASVNPNLYMDVDGQFRGTDDKIHTANGFSNYSVFSLWDTHRAYHPLMTIINQKRTTDWINTFLAQDEYGGMLPVWELSGNETFCMIGYHSVPVIADAYQKGIRGFDAKKALAAMRRYAEGSRFGLPFYRTNGFLSNDKESESVSKTLEYAYDDWCIGQMAKWLGDEETAETYLKRAQQYKNLFDPVSGHMRGKLGAMWYSPFDPREINHFFTEGNSWQYSFTAQQDIAGLIKLYGGRQTFAARLNELFTTVSKTTGRDQADVTGLIGQYAQGNEPSHHMAYLFNFVGRPWQTQYYLNKIFNGFYKNAPDGLIGNEDCGQMSAWYILSAMGFYSVTPGSGQYILGTPVFDKVTIHLENGKQFVIKANRKKPGDFYVQSATLNGKPHSQSFLQHTALMQGGELQFNLGAMPNKKWATADSDIPVTAINDHLITPVPYLTGNDKKFKGSTSVEIKSIEPGTTIFYAVTPLHGSGTNAFFQQYSAPLPLKHSATVYAYAVKNGQQSQTIEQDFYRLPEDKTVQVISKMNAMYSAGGPEALIDSIIGGANYRTGEWQSYEGNDFEAVVDLKQSKPVHYVGAHFLQDVGSWIWMPRSVSFEASNDGKTFQPLGDVQNTVSDKDYKASVKEFGLAVQTEARYIRVKAMNYGKIPDWHPGKGGNAHIFIDEIMVR
ncbi:GH92 family glycosyl hydrolase [Flavisolibacter nicotianae]|uniref:GH92 family glycosyl hydrolase n=1 Tax=Flavisolibacter nicotianae TaxID=2364882 RepID=UPI000EB15FA0|nr:GH92 family glycosyl hydrolase [Flavisolibacter nicotianae]